MIRFLKIIQYIILFLLTLFWVDLLFDSFKGFVWLFLLIAALVLHLKWISIFPVSYAAMYFINGMLTLMSFMILSKICISILGRNTTSILEGSIIFCISILPVILWWSIDVIALMKKIPMPLIRLGKDNNSSLQSLQDLSKDSVITGKSAGLIKKWIQYSLLLLLIFSLLISILLHKGIASLLIYATLIIFIGLTLNWISRYSVSKWGIFFINGLLSLVTFVMIVGLYFAIGRFAFGRTNTISGEGLAVMVVAILPTFLWWKLDVIRLLQKKSRGL